MSARGGLAIRIDCAGRISYSWLFIEDVLSCYLVSCYTRTSIAVVSIVPFAVR